RAPAAIAVAQQRASDLPNVSFRAGDPAEIAFASPFDAVVGRYALQFEPDPAQSSAPADRAHERRSFTPCRPRIKEVLDEDAADAPAGSARAAARWLGLAVRDRLDDRATPTPQRTSSRHEACWRERRRVGWRDELR